MGRSGRDQVLISARRGQRLIERRQQLSDGSADFAGKRAALIEIDRMRPGPGASYLDARTQMDVAVAKALEERVELLVILGAGRAPGPPPFEGQRRPRRAGRGRP